MAIIVETNYSKKLGLPGYSSHQYSVSVRTEVSDLSLIEAESTKLYRILQDAVDHEIQHVGFIGDTAPPSNGAPPRNNGGDHWACSPKQKDLILKLVDDHKLDKSEVEALAKGRFNLPVKTLNRLQASGLIEELIEKFGKATRRDRR